jgi:hypothetical protein
MIPQPYALFAVVSETWRGDKGRLESDVSIGRVVGWKEAADGVAYPFTIPDGRAGAAPGAVWRGPAEPVKGRGVKAVKDRTVEFYVFSDHTVANNALTGIAQTVARGVDTVREREGTS